MWRLRERNFCSGKCRVRHHRSAFRNSGLDLSLNVPLQEQRSVNVGKYARPAVEFDSLLMMERFDPKAGGYPER